MEASLLCERDALNELAEQFELNRFVPTCSGHTHNSIRVNVLVGTWCDVAGGGKYEAQKF